MKAPYTNWSNAPTSRKRNTWEVNPTYILTTLAVLMFAYIAFRFVYPLIVKGFLW
jgi:hypothetical protein